jgi:hypothetical protein
MNSFMNAFMNVFMNAFMNAFMNNQMFTLYTCLKIVNKSLICTKRLDQDRDPTKKARIRIRTRNTCAKYPSLCENH